MHLSYAETCLFHVFRTLLQSIHAGAGAPCHELRWTAHADLSPGPHDPTLRRQPEYQSETLVTFTTFSDFPIRRYILPNCDSLSRKDCGRSIEYVSKIRFEKDEQINWFTLHWAYREKLLVESLKCGATSPLCYQIFLSVTRKSFFGRFVSSNSSTSKIS
jgi:hypothetical protein